MLTSDLFVLTLLALTAAWYMVWRRYRDPFHPLIYFLPQFAFLYGYLPLELALTDGFSFEQYVRTSTLYFYHFVALVLIGFFAWGVRVGSNWRSVANPAPMGHQRNRIATSRAFILACVLGTVGFAAWLYTLQIAGGFVQAYSRAYGGGWSSSGYILEVTRVGIVGALIVFVSRKGKLRAVDMAVLALCLAPTLIEAFLGARRGPAFIGLVVLMGSFLYFRGKRISAPVLITGGFIVGLTLLVLVSQRSNIYLGSSELAFGDPLQALRAGEANEYIIGAAVVEYTEQHGVFFGAREFVWLLARFIPIELWPTIYTDLPRALGVTVDLTITGGVDREGVATVTGWTPAVGSAEGFVGSLWLEFGWLSLGVSALIGFLYGRTWRAAKYDLFVRPIYVLMVAFSIYLVMQALDPWLYRLLLFGIPTYFLTRALAKSSVMPQSPAIRLRTY